MTHRDSFARTIAREAIQKARAAEAKHAKLEQELLELVARQPRRRNSIFYGKCGLCGAPCRDKNYCHEHEWAEGS